MGAKDDFNNAVRDALAAIAAHGIPMCKVPFVLESAIRVARDDRLGGVYTKSDLKRLIGESRGGPPISDSTFSRMRREGLLPEQIGKNGKSPVFDKNKTDEHLRRKRHLS